MNPKTMIEGIERGAAVLRALGTIAEEADHYIHGDGPEPLLLQQLPELQAPFALERARARQRRGA
jgi:hypothetical protein